MININFDVALIKNEISCISQFDINKLKTISEILDPTPLYGSVLLDLISWVSQYYHHPVGDTFQTAMLGALASGEKLNPESEVLWKATPEGIACDLDSLKRAAKQRAAMEYLKQCSADKTTLAKLDIATSTLKTLEQKGLIEKTSQIIEQDQRS